MCTRHTQDSHSTLISISSFGPIPPSRTSQSSSLGSLGYTATSYQLSILHIKSESHSVPSNSLQPHGLYSKILQARTLEWVAFPFSRESSQPRVKPRSHALQADSLPVEPQGKPNYYYYYFFFFLHMVILERTS